MHGSMQRVGDASLSIGDLSSRTGCKVETIRFYETIGLLPEPHRTSGNQRRYQGEHVERLRFILHAREFGLPIDDIRELIALQEEPKASCAKAHDIARRQLLGVEQKIERLNVLADELRRLVERECDTCVADCRVFSTLASCGAHGHDGDGSCRMPESRSERGPGRAPRLRKSS